MNIIFFGTSQLGVNALEALIKAKENIVCVVTAADKKSGRGMKVNLSPIKELALKYKIEVFQPESINNSAAMDFLKNHPADIFIVIAYGKILKKEILELPKFGSINVHASLLPKYRGAAPINWAIANGEPDTGLTIIKMNEFMDQGDIILQKKIPIETEDDALVVSKKIAKLAPEILLEALKLIKNNKADLTRQDEKQATHAPILNKNHGLIRWNRAAGQIKNQVRAFVPWPGSFTYYKGKLIKILKCEILDELPTVPPGEIQKIDETGITVAAKNSSILIKELQPEAKKPMTAQEFVNGYKIIPGNRLG